MPLSSDPDGFIPLRLEELGDRLAQDLTAEDKPAFLALSHWVSRLAHAEFFETRERLKSLYRAFDPDRAAGHGARKDKDAFFETLDQVMITAHYRRLRVEDLLRVDHRQGRLGARIRVVEDVFTHVALYGRGQAEREIEIKSLFGLRRRKAPAVAYDQVMLAAHIDPGTKPRVLARWRLEANKIYLKHFGDIAKGDLRTLYPTARMVMPVHSQLMLGVPALVAGVPLIMKFVPQVTLLLVVTGAYLGISGTWEQDLIKQALAAAAGLGALGGFLARQYSSYDRYDLRNQREVIENAYYNKLGSNRGAFDTLISAAEDAQVKEVLVAYWALRATPQSRAALKAEAEGVVERLTGAKIDFDVDDALALLRSYDLVIEEQGTWRAVPLARALFSCATAWSRTAHPPAPRQ